MLFDKEIVLLLCKDAYNFSSRLVLTYRDRYTGSIGIASVRKSYMESFTLEERKRSSHSVGSFEVKRIYFPDQPLPTKLLSFRGRREVGGVNVIVSQELPSEWKSGV